MTDLLGVDFVALFAALGICIQIFFVDLLLSADNAVMIALACRGLPPARMRMAALIGTVAAVALRIGMAAIVLLLLQVPYLKILAGVTLVVVAVRLTGERRDLDLAAGRTPGRDMRDAVVAIIVADAVMSFDNVVAVAAIARGSLLLLGLGLAMSIPMLIQGSAMIREFLDANAAMVTLAGMFLGWVAGQIGVSDPTVAPWIAETAPALVIAVPAACAVFVLWEARILAAGGGGLHGR